MARVFAILVVVLVSMRSQIAFAVDSPSLRIRADGAPTPLQLIHGQKKTILVELAGLPSGVTLDSLAATITFDSSLFGMPVIQSGAVVPTPLADGNVQATVEAFSRLADQALESRQLRRTFRPLPRASA